MRPERHAAKHNNHVPSEVIPQVGECTKATQPSSVRNIFLSYSVLSQIIQLTLKSFFLILRTLFTPFFRFQIWQGMERHSKQAISVAYIGDLENCRYLQGLVFDQSPEATKWRALYWWELKRTMRNIQKDIDLSLMDFQFPVSLWFQKDGALNVPRWVKQRVCIAPDWESVERGMRRKT